MHLLKILHITLLIGFFNCTFGQTNIEVLIEVENRSIKIEVKENDQEIAEFYSGSRNNTDSLSSIFHEFWNSSYPQHTHLFLYFHSLYGGTILYKDIAHATIKNTILDSASIPLFIIDWDTWNPLYGKNQDLAIDVGKSINNLFHPFFNYPYKIHSLHHSMGARVLEGMLPELEESQRLDQVFLVAPDLDSTFLRRDSSLIAEHINDLHIFYSPNDLVLGLAELLNQEKRLGNMKKAKQQNHIHLYDTRELDCLLNNNHLNWLTCRDIRDIIRDQLHQVYFEE